MPVQIREAVHVHQYEPEPMSEEEQAQMRASAEETDQQYFSTLANMRRLQHLEAITHRDILQKAANASDPKLVLAKGSAQFNAVHPKNQLAAMQQKLRDTYFVTSSNKEAITSNTATKQEQSALDPQIRTELLKAQSQAYLRVQSTRNLNYSAKTPAPLNTQTKEKPVTQQHYSRAFPAAEKAANGTAHMAQQAQQFLANAMIDTSGMFHDVAQRLGPGATFEDVIVHIMMQIAAHEQRNVMYRIRSLQRGGTTLNGYLKNRAGDFAGAAGALLGGVIAGPEGAVAGREIGHTVASSVVGENTPESRQLEFEQIKFAMGKLSEMTTCISAILSTMHQTSKNTAGAIRG